MTHAATTSQDLLHRTTDTAKHFKISEMTLYRWRKTKGFPQPLKRGQVVLYDIAAIKQWLAGGEA